MSYLPLPLRARLRALRRRGAGPSRKRRTAIAAFGLATLCLSVGVAVAAPAGNLDPSFDGDGKLILPFDGTPVATLVQPDGKIVLVASGAEHILVHRLKPDGSLDRGFGGDGTAIADFGNIATASAAALQPDGRIVVAGTLMTEPTRGVVARFDSDGSLDETFGGGGDGKKLLNGLSRAGAVLLEPDGRIVLAGEAESRFGILRLSESGGLDGTEFEPAAFADDSYANAAALAADGRIVLAGGAYAVGSGQWRAAIAVYEPGGALDQTFAGTGKLILGPGAPTPAEKVLVQPDGKILVAGDSGTADTKMLVTRVGAAGTVDTSFGADGTATADFAGREDLADAVLAPDGRIALFGAAESISSYSFAAARLTPAGLPDPGFGDGGLTTIPFGLQSLGYSGALQADGRMVVAGRTTMELVTGRVAVARLLADPPPGGGAGGDSILGGGDVAVDRTAPRVGSLSLSRRVFRVGRRPLGAPRRVRSGTAFRFHLSEAASVTFAIERMASGRRVRGQCRPVTGASRLPPCRRYEPSGSIARALSAGGQLVAFSGYLSGRALPPASYRVVVQARDAANIQSNKRTAAFRIVP